MKINRDLALSKRKKRYYTITDFDDVIYPK